MILNGVNAFLYQISLLPLYSMIATQKIVICNSNAVLGMIDPSGFKVRIGRGDLQKASNTAAGECMVSFYESEADDIGKQSSKEAVADGANEILSRGGKVATTAFKNADKSRSDLPPSSICPSSVPTRC